MDLEDNSVSFIQGAIGLGELVGLSERDGNVEQFYFCNFHILMP
jgi:hypothetical protein